MNTGMFMRRKNNGWIHHTNRKNLISQISRMDTTAIVNVNTTFKLNFLAFPKNILPISTHTLSRWTECIR